MAEIPTRPRQERSRQTHERLMNAAEQLFDERGDQGFTIADLAARAGTSVGTVYRRFSTKEDILLAVQERFHQEHEVQILGRWATQDWTGMDDREMVENLVRSLAVRWRQHAPLMRVLMARRLQGREDQVYRNSIAAMKRRSATFQAVLMTRRDSIVQPDPEEAIQFAFRMVEGMCSRWTAHSIESVLPPDLDWDGMLRQLSDALAAYLFGILPESGDRPAPRGIATQT